jgi:RNA polymerase sigma-70 factor, ECF subfamily
MPTPSPDDDVDAHVLELAARDDASAWRIISRRVFRKVGAILGKGSSEVEDAVQDTLVKISKALRGPHRPRVKGERAAAWVTTVASNTAIDHLRSARRRASFSEPTCLEGDGDPGDPATPLPIALEEILSLDEAMGSLCEDDREVIALRHYAGLSCAEVAARLGIPENTVRSRAFRAIVKLREYLENEGGTNASNERIGQ